MIRRIASSPLMTLVIASLLIAPSILFVILRLTIPGDQTQTQLDVAPGIEGGLIIDSVAPASNSLSDGDIVVGIDRRPLDTWLADTMRGRSNIPAGDASLVYSVIRNGTEQNVEVRWGTFPLLQGVAKNWSGYVFLIYLQLISFFVFVRRPHLPMARQFFLLSSVIVGSSVAFFLGVQISDLLNPLMLGLWLWCSIVLFGLVAAGYVHFALVFPRMSRTVAQRPWLLIAVYIGVWIPYAILVGVGWAEATGPISRLLLAVRGTAIMTLVAFPLGIGITIYTYVRRLRASEKRQMRWLLWAIFTGTVPWLIVSVIPSLLGESSQVATNVIGLTWCTIPTAFAIAILREGLFDIDVIIRRTLVYSVLTGILALVYFGGVALMQSAFVTLTGEESPLAIVASTLGIAALFSPLRSRVQAFVDRRFYRSKYDAERTLEAFADSMRDEVDIEHLQAALLAVVEETMQPESVSLWVNQRKEHKT